MQASAGFTKLVVVKRKTMVEELVERHGTRGQARFLAENRGESFAGVEQAHETYEQARQALRKALPAGIRSQWIDRGFLPNFLFGPHELVVTLGADGLVVNVAKYLSTQPILAINPDPSPIDGVLVPVRIDAAAPALAAALAGGIPARRITMARARLDDGQTIDAINDLFIGIQSHASARYRIEYRRNVESQSSSGVIVSTDAGSTGWYRSVLTAAAGLATAHLGKKAVGNLADRYAFDATARELRFSVREPFTSLSSMGTIICGAITGSETFDIVSQMPTGGVIFSDGMESDFVEFEAGMRARIGIADRCLELLWPGA